MVDSAAQCRLAVLTDSCSASTPVHVCRYETASEDGSLCMAFHTPTDAVAWCLSMQTALVKAHWPLALEQHARTKTCGMPTNNSTHPTDPQVIAALYRAGSTA